LAAAVVDTGGVVAMAIEAATAMSMVVVVVANGAMAVATVEEVIVAIGIAEARPDMVATEGAVATVTAADTAAATTTTTISSRHTIFKARWLSIF
jgi:hypothetical protein